MFIETLEFTIPVDLCGLFTTLQKGPRSNFEFPASVNSYGTTQDASIQVQVRANKLTFKVEGVSSESSIISKSECRTLKLSVFDVDRSLIPEEPDYNGERVSFPSKRSHDDSISTPIPVKNSRTSYSNYTTDIPTASPIPNIPQKHLSKSHGAKSKQQSGSPLDVKQEPEDPDLIEIEPDPEPEDVEPKTETPYMQIDYSSTGPCTQTSQAALDRLSFPHSSPSTSSFHQNVPHVPDYAEAGPSQRHTSHSNQGGDDYLVYQDENDRDDYGDNDNSADYSNEGVYESGPELDWSELQKMVASRVQQKSFSCPVCLRSFRFKQSMQRHKESVHDVITYTCVCGKTYAHSRSMHHHKKTCSLHARSQAF